MTADLSALLAAATPGPWFNDHGKVGRTASGRGIGEMDHTDDGELAARAPVLAQACLDAETALAEFVDECGVVFADPRVGYVEIQINVGSIERGRAALALLRAATGGQA